MTTISTTETYRELTRASREAWERARLRIPAGVTSNVRFFKPYPVFMSRASGSRVYDVDGHEYIDYCMAFGPLIAGHGHPQVMQAIRAELDRRGTVIFGASTELELTLAERLTRLIPSAEMVRFTNSGTESTMHAIRLARGVTGRSRIVKFEGNYHGGHDSVLIGLDGTRPPRPANDGIPTATQDNTLVLPFNDSAAARETIARHGDEIAAVIIEPVARGALAADRAFLQDLRTLTSERGIVLIFDEVVAWPRVSLAGAQGALGVTPDLTALGKAVGGGLPMGAVVGSRALMAHFAPRDARGSGESGAYVFHGGTYNGTPIALAAGLATLDLLEEPGVYDRLMRMGAYVRETLSNRFTRDGIPAQVIGEGAAFDFYFAESPIRSLRDIWASDVERRERVDYRLLELGIYNSPLHRFHLSLAHTDDDVEATLAALAEATTRPCR
jgi:glutamate-1-semialdehyde 2,1-aminomutase